MELSELYNATLTWLEAVYEFLHQEFIDLYYVGWLAYVFYPLVVTFVLPIIIMIFLYSSAIFLQLYRLRHHLKDAYSARDIWDSARRILAIFWEAQGKIWHAHEIIGFDRIPNEGPALIIFYHGAIPIDFYYLYAQVILHKKRQIHAIGDRFLFKIPGFRLLMDVFCVSEGTVSRAVEVMKQGHLMAIAPGGVREAYFSDEHYELVWGKRTGFAKVALEAKVPIIPVFTQNCREAFRALSFGRSLFRKLYEKTRLPLVPLYGGIPVKLRTFIGDPIPYDPHLSADQLAIKVQRAVEGLIQRHQAVPGNILRALLERFYTPAHCKQT